MSWKREWKALAAMVAVFLVSFYLPIESPRLRNAVLESLALVRWYAREHVLLCLIPAFFIAGAISVFVSKESVMKYLGARANKVLSYGVASVSGSVLAVCSCTVLPLFAGISRMGAGLGPACAFLYSGPAINVLAIIMTARVLGPSLGIARAVGAVLFSIIIGLLMHLIFRKEEIAKAEAQAALPKVEVPRPLWQTAAYFALMVGILIFANWAKPAGAQHGVWHAVFTAKWMITGVLSIGLAAALVAWFKLPVGKTIAAGAPALVLALLMPSQPMIAFVAAVIGISVITSADPGEMGEWFGATWGFAKQILPLLLFGILAAGIFLGRPGGEGIIPPGWVSNAVGGNSVWANLFASLAGAFMYFATLTEVPILQGLIGNGMGKGPALALLLAGPALSLPSMLVLGSIMGTRKTITYCLLVVCMATITGMLYGALPV